MKAEGVWAEQNRRNREMEKRDCSFIDDCFGCRSNKGEGTVCGACKFYRTIDSGYGYCIVFPTFKAMAWCRDICGQFVRGEK